MSRTLTALVVTPAITYCTQDGTPYRADTTGIIHVEARHVTELVTTRAVATLATAATLGATAHKGAPLMLVVEA
jgi:nitrous oxidase accessory protein NosD